MRIVRSTVGALLALTLFSAVPALAADGSVVINEIYYNPPDEFDLAVPPLDVEFLELHNPGDTAIDLSGMSFVGFTYTFPAGSTLEPDSYMALAGSSADFATTYGVPPAGQFELGGLSGKGELIQLLAADGVTVVDEVLYDDTAPWPGAPDGTGPSLELINPAFDNSVPTSWAPSLNNIPTPAAANSVFAELPPPGVQNVRTVPPSPAAASDFVVSAEISGAIAPSVFYRIDVEPTEVGPVPMTLGPDDVWTASIPGQPGGTLVRYRIADGDLQAPAVGDTIDYFGVVITDPDLASTQLNVLQFWLDISEYDRIYSDRLSEESIPVVVAFDGQVIDKAAFRQRGGSSRNFVKRNYKIELPKGYLIDFGVEGRYPLDEFNLQADRGDVPYSQTLLSWDIAAEQGEADIVNFHVRAERNGDFFGLYRIQEAYDGTFRFQNGFDDGELYKVEPRGFNNPSPANGFDKKDPDDLDYSGIASATAELKNSNIGERTDWVYDNVDVPAVINYAAITALLRHGDQDNKNFYVHFDGPTGQWSQLLWDLDQTWLWDSTGPCPADNMTIPTCLNNPLLNAVLEVPEFEALYWRRIQTLVDTHLVAGELEARRDELMSKIDVAEAEMDLQIWGLTERGTNWDSNLLTDPFYTERWENSIRRRRESFAIEARMPGPEGPVEPIVINELHYNPADFDGPEFIELYNPNPVARDLCGWTIEGIELNIRCGTVIPANGYLVFTENIPAFRARYPDNVYVGGQYPGGLSGKGEVVTLRNAEGRVEDVVSYDDVDPWPVEADGNGPSLSLKTSAVDNSLPESWSADVLGGTPGTRNDDIPPPPDPTTVTISDVSVEEPDAGQTTTATIDLTFGAPAQIGGSFGFTTMPGTAVAGADYASVAGVVAIAVGDTSASIEITINGDDLLNGDRTFSVVPTDLQNVVPTSEAAVVTIVDNEIPPPPPTDLNVTIGDEVVPLTVESYSGQDRNPDGAELSVDQNALTLSGNSWKGVEVNYTVTENTVLEFDFSSNDLAEVHAIGLESDRFPTSNLLFQLDGSQRYGRQDLRDYSSARPGVKRYSIPVGEFLNARTYKTLVFVNDMDSAPGTQQGSFANVVLREQEPPPLPQLTVEINDSPFVADVRGFNREDRGGEVQTLNREISIAGNSWQYIDLGEYVITRDTVIEFDFMSTSEGEVHGIGFDTNLFPTFSRAFRVFGTQAQGRSNYDDQYTVGETVRYEIAVGKFFRGRQRYLVFINDDDRAPVTAQSTFSNIVIRETVGN